MKFRGMLVVLALGILCSSASAAVRTFTVNSNTGGALLANLGSNQFELQDISSGGLSDNIAYGSEVITSNSVTVSPVPPGFGNAALYGVNHSATAFLFHFQDPVNTNHQIYVTLGSGVFGSTALGADVPDGTDANALVVYYDSAAVSPNPIQVGNASITIGTVAVPEPSAFAFGGLAVVATGIGRWIRRRKVTA